MITTAKGLTSAYAPLGAVLASDRVAEPFLHGTETFNARLHLRRAPDGVRGGAREHRRDGARGAVRARARQRGRASGRCSRALRDLPIVGDVRGAGYFQAIELVKDKDTKETFNHEESEHLLRGFLSGELYRRGLICRTDDRGDPIVQLSPPLIAGQEQFEEIESILRPVLTEACERMGRWSSPSRASSRSSG